MLSIPIESEIKLHALITVHVLQMGGIAPLQPPATFECRRNAKPLHQRCAQATCSYLRHAVIGTVRSLSKAANAVFGNTRNF